MAVRLTPAEVAVKRTFCAAVTLCVEMANDTVEAPAGTVTLAGPEAVVLLEVVRLTTMPPDGAAPVRVTEPVAAAPPTREAGEIVSDDSAGGGGGGGGGGATTGATVTTAVFVTPR